MTLKEKESIIRLLQSEDELNVKLALAMFNEVSFYKFCKDYFKDFIRGKLPLIKVDEDEKSVFYAPCPFYDIKYKTELIFQMVYTEMICYKPYHSNYLLQIAGSLRKGKPYHEELIDYNFYWSSSKIYNERGSVIVKTFKDHEKLINSYTKNIFIGYMREFLEICMSKFNTLL